MARVPIYEPRIAPTGTTQQRHVAADHGESGLGRGLQRLGDSLADAAEREAQIRVARAENDARAADNAIAPAIAEIEGGFLNLRGAGATSEAMDEARSRISALKGESGLTDATSRGLFNRVFEQRLVSSIARMQSHSIEQLRVGTIETSEARILTAGRLAVDTRFDPAGFTQNMATMETESRSLADAQGWSEDRRLAWLGGQVSNVHRRVVETLRSEGESGPRLAEEWLNRNADLILDEDERMLRDGLAEPLAQLQADDDFQRALSSPVGGDGGATSPSSQAPPSPTPHEPERFAFRPAMITPRGRAGQGARQHRARGSNLAVDIPAPHGDPVYAPVEGVVERVDDDPSGAGGRQVWVRHSDGRITGYAHLSRVTAQRGDRVGPTRALGAVGSTGRSSGPHVHFTVRNAAGQLVDPAGQRWGGGDGEGGAFVRNSPRVGGTEQMYDRAYAMAEAEGWSQRRLDRLLARVDFHAGRNRAMLAEQEEVAGREAADATLRLGPRGLTSHSQLGDAYFRMSPQQRLSYEELIRTNQRPASPVDNWTLMEEIQVARFQDPRAFLERNVAHDLARLSPGQQSTYNGWRLEALKNAAKPDDQPNQVSHSLILRVSAPLLTASIGERPSAKEKKGKDRAEWDRKAVRFREAMSVAIDNWQRRHPNQQIGQNDIYEIARVLTTHVTLTDGETTPVFSRGDRAPSTLHIPTEQHQRIIAEFQRRYGRRPTNREISELYFEIAAP